MCAVFLLNREEGLPIGLEQTLVHSHWVSKGFSILARDGKPTHHPP